MIKLWPKALNDKLDGGARKGHCILVYGRPNSGKTLVAINLVSGFLRQGLRVLYVGNEEPAEDILQRFHQRLLKTTKDQIRANPAKVREALKRTSIDKLTVAPLSPGTFPELRRLLESVQYDVLVLDQLRNLRVKAATRVEELESAATEARNLGKRYGLLVVAITQAGDSATGKAILDMNDIDGSKTGIPAQADLMLGVGSTDEMRRAGMLTLSLPKNKLSGDHEPVTVQYDVKTGVLQ